MLPQKPRHLVYALALLLFSAIGTTAIANNKVHRIFTEVASVLKETASAENKTTEDSREGNVDSVVKVAESMTTVSDAIGSGNSRSSASSAAMFMTIIQGADEVVTCSVDGTPVARFNLCGNSDNRTISLSGSYSSVSWQVLGGGADINDDCPNFTGSYTQVATGPVFNLDASTVSATTGAEYRVIANGSPHYFKVKKSTITQNTVKTDFICGNPGRIQVTGLSSAYEFSIDNGSGFGPWQGPIFDNLDPDTYIVKARLRDTPNTCEYPYSPVTIEQLDIDIDVTFTDANCSGETGTITVTVGDVPGPYKYTLLDNTGTAQEFTAFIPDNPYTFSAVGFGTYTVQVETPKCTGDALAGIDPPRQDRDTSNNPIVIGAGVTPLSASAEPTNSFSAACGINNVDINVFTSGGTAPYSYIVNGVGPSSPDYTSTRVENVTSPGTYEFLITDANGCTITASANVAELTPPDIDVVGVDGTCTNGGARLEFTVNDAKGFDLEYRATPGDVWSPNPVLSVAATAGGTTYNNIQVQYTSGAFTCVMDMPDVITVRSVGALTGTAAKNADVSCNLGGGTTGGEIEFTGPFGGGSGSGFRFSIDGVNFTTTLVYSGLTAGTYSPVMIDNSGCRRDFTPITIDGVTPPTNIDFAQSNINCGAGTSDVQLTPTFTNPIVTYEIISPTTASNATGLFTGLNTGTTYEFRIIDDRNCSYTETFTPVTISSIQARVKSGGDLRVCIGATDGSGAFIIDGFGTDYTYNINGGTESAPQSDREVVLPPSGANTYTITVTDVDTGCTDTASFDIEEPTSAITLSGNVTDMSCANGNRGRVRANASGGWGGYRYTLETPGPDQGPKSGRTFGNLSAEGNYKLIVVDAEGCRAEFDFTLTEVDAPTIALDAGPSNYCYEPGTGATLAVSSTAGSAPAATHQYRINGGSLQGSPIFTGLTPGSYTIEVVDDNNCTSQVTTDIEPQLRADARVFAEVPCGGADGIITVNVSGGHGMVQYEVNHNSSGFGAPVAQTGSTFDYPTNVDGDYVFRITDSEGCTTETSPITLSPAVNIAPATWEAIPVSCGGGVDNGRVTITPDATSGVPPYEVNFDGRGWSEQTVYSNLAAGTYSYLVQDSRGCLTPADYVLIGTSTAGSPDAAVTDLPATCSAGSLSGGIEVTGVTNGTSDFTFIVQDNFGNELARLENVNTFPAQINDSSLVLGDYTVVTLDANGCRDEDAVTISTTEVVINPINFTPAVTCDDTGFTYTVEVTPTIFPTLPTYEIRLAGQPAFYALNNNAGADTHEFSNATDGIQYGVAYTVEVLAPNGCIYEQEIPPIDGASDIDITAVSSSAFCDDIGNGRADFTVADFIGPDLDIEITDLDTGSAVGTDNPTGLTGGLGSSYNGSFDIPPGSYQILVTDTDGCTDAVNVDVFLNSPDIDILSNVPANCNALGQLTFQGNGGTPFATGSPYLYAVVPQGDPVVYLGPADTTDDFNDETTRTLAGSVTGVTYDIWVVDSRGCTFNVTDEIVQLQPDLVVPDPIVDNQCDPTATSFDIIVWVPDTVDTPRFTLNGQEELGVLNAPLNRFEFTYQVNSPGSYPVDVVDANGCSGQGTATVSEFLFASAGTIVQPSCSDDDGELTIDTSGGSGNFDYELTGTDFLTNPVGPISQSDDPLFTNLAPGTYSVTVTDRDVSDGAGNCTVDVTNIQIEEAIDLDIDTVEDTDISCNGETDGSITVNIDAANPGDQPLVFTLFQGGTSTVVQTNGTGFFDNLGMGTYDVTVVSAKNCEDRRDDIEISEPPLFTINATADPFVCEPGANRFSSTTVETTIGDVGTPGYQYSITGFGNYQTTPDFEIVDDGNPAGQTITVYAIDANGCQATATVNIAAPTEVVPTLTVIDPLNCRDGEVIEISVVNPIDFTVSTTAPGATSVADVSVINGTTATITLPVAGDYTFVVQHNIMDGCSYPLPLHTVNVPQNPTVTIREANPVVCDMPGNTGGLFIEVADYTGIYTYNVYEASDTTKSSILATGGFDTNNFPDASGDPARIPGLAGGNYFVEVISDEEPFCTADSGVATIRVPNGPLTVTASPVGNVSCDNNTGTIVATGSGGWDNNPYMYRLLSSSDGGISYPTEVVPFSTTAEFTGLSFGFYRVEITDSEGCPAFDDIELEEVPQITAGIREPLGLVCPGGNNAVLEAFNTTTGNPGAEGGVAGAGYKYQLIYLNSDAPDTSTPSGLDERDRSGLQDDPTFTGTSGGVISAGWYAIEVTSSFNCNFVTPPYEVIPPPPVEPVLRQTAVPGCGGRGEMEFSIGNPDPDPTVVYEFRYVENDVPVSTYADMTGTSFLFPGDAGIVYQIDVRKKNVANVCDAVRSEGIRMTDATDIFLSNNAIDDISCSGENDGRIETFATGGVGDDTFSLYIGDPVDAFSPDASARLIRTQDFGTFEGLDEESTQYYVTVISGLTCSDIAGPFSIVRPEPILFTPTETPVSCTGEEDGSITLEVTSGGVGLIQFAIAPNFNEFFSDPDNPSVYTFEDLAAGDYEVLIQDENGCFEKDIITVAEPDELIVTDVATTPETCIDAADGTALLTIAGGTPFVDETDPLNPIEYYETRLVGPGSDGTEVFERNESLFLENLPGGVSYIVFVRDANMCDTFVEIPIEIGVDLTAEPIVQYGCEGIFPNSTTRVALDDESRLDEILFALDPVDPSDAITSMATEVRSWGDLPAGDHIVYIYHENGCTTFVEFTIDAYEPLTLEAEKTGPNELTAVASGGFGGYEYFFNGESYGEEGVYTTTESGVVEVRVVDQNGCVAVASIPFEFTGMLELPNFFTPNGDNENDFWSPRNREFFPDIEVIIYDRYGRVVAELDQVSEWDGLYEGNELPSGDYWYVVNQNDDRDTRYVGHFTLYR